MIIRSASKDDLPALIDIYNQAISETESTCYLEPLSFDERQEWWNAHPPACYPILVLEQADAVLGYASLSAWMDGPVYARTVEVSLFLRPEARSQGWGTQLMQAITDEAQRLGHHVLVARIWQQNTASLALCRRSGFETVGVQREVGWRNGVWQDCVVLQRFLPALPPSTPPA